MTTPSNSLPVAVIGAGPVGLAAAAHLLARGEIPIVLEAGDAVGASIREWSHVRFFSPWKYTVDAASVALLEPMGWTVPDPESAPTGRDIVERYLEPLVALPQICPYVRFNARVTAIARRGHDKMKTPGREHAPFMLRVETPDGQQQMRAKAVIDASGTWNSPNPIGADGLAALGESAAAAHVFYGIPDVLGAQRERYAGKRVAVVGSGHSAFNALLELADLAQQAPGTEITWILRRKQVGQLFGGEEKDALPERGRLGSRTRQLVESDVVRFESMRIAEVRGTVDGLLLVGEDGDIIGPVDEVICATGFRPDLSLTRELRLDLDPAVEAPRALAPLIDPNVHSCGTVPPHGAEELRHPERDFFTVGMKSYGRAPTFLLLTGYEQVRSVVAAIAGDWDAARNIELILPETGVCSTSSSNAEASCCASESVEGERFAHLAADLVLPVLDVVATPSPIPLAESAPEVSRCCSTTEQSTCCEPSDKATCCGTADTATSSECGCR